MADVKKLAAYDLILGAEVGTKFILTDIRGKADWNNKVVTMRDEIAFTGKINVVFYEPTEKGIITIHGSEK